MIAKEGSTNFGPKSEPVSANLIARDPRACGRAASSCGRMALVPRLFDAAGASVTTDGVAVVAGLIRRQLAIAAGRCTRVPSDRGAPLAMEATLDCASCRAPVARHGGAIVASLRTSPLAVSADCVACGSIAVWCSAAVPGFPRASAAAPITIDGVAVVAPLACSLIVVATD